MSFLEKILMIDYVGDFLPRYERNPLKKTPCLCIDAKGEILQLGGEADEILVPIVDIKDLNLEEIGVKLLKTAAELNGKIPT